MGPDPLKPDLARKRKAHQKKHETPKENQVKSETANKQRKISKVLMPKRDHLKDNQKNTKTANQQQEKSRDGRAKHHQNKIEPMAIKNNPRCTQKKGMKR